MRQNLLLMRPHGGCAPTRGVALYTGFTDGIYNGAIANDFANDGWQFFPVEILNKDGSPYKDIYYVWWVHKKLDAIDPTSEGVKPVAGDEIDGRHRWTHIGAKTPERLPVLKSVVSGVTAWSDFRFFPSHGIFISDALSGDMVAQGMSGFAADSVWSDV